ncbi:hypothetical protein [Archangium sp.]|uniref:hypothetical protein n=1 Tax=Archangium sp. TaxID=1872627 RepID=UPI00389AD2B2
MNKQDSLRETLALVAAGLGVGWLMGLSVSPVLLTVITGIVAVASSVISALAGLKPEETAGGSQGKARNLSLPKATAVPLGIFISTLAIGASLGVWARTHQWLAPHTREVAEQWEKVGVSRREVVRRLFEQQFPATAPERYRQWLDREEAQLMIDQWSKTLNKRPEEVAEVLFRLQFSETSKDLVPPRADTSLLTNKSGVLFSGMQSDECSELTHASDEDLQGLFQSVPENKKVKDVASALKTPQSLRKLAEILCTGGMQ